MSPQPQPVKYSLNFKFSILQEQQSRPDDYPSDSERGGITIRIEDVDSEEFLSVNMSRSSKSFSSAVSARQIILGKCLVKGFAFRSDNTGYESDVVSPVVRIQFLEQPNIQSRKVPLKDQAIQPGSNRDNSIIQGTEF